MVAIFRLKKSAKIIANFIFKNLHIDVIINTILQN